MKRSHELYYAAQRADDAYSRELVRVYGAKRARDMRYQPKLFTDRKLKAAELRKKRADAALHKEWARERNPSRSSIHTAKWDRCVKAVKKRGGAAPPYAVCTAKLGERGSVKKKHRRKANRLPAIRPIYYVVTATKGRETLWLTRVGKLTRSKLSAARHKTPVLAVNAARKHLIRYPSSRSYRFSVRLAY